MKRQAVLCKVPKVCQIWCRISGRDGQVLPKLCRSYLTSTRQPGIGQNTAKEKLLDHSYIFSGHSDGVCDETDDCLCSGESVEKHFCSDEHYDEDEQHTICAGFCQFKGKQTGKKQNVFL